LLDAADEGKFVRAKQIETNALGSDEAVSASTGEITAGSAGGLLDSYKGSAFAMSPDTLLYSTYSATDDISGSVTNGDPGQFSVAILRDSDNAVRSFTPAEVADGTANTWVQAGVGGAANGFVRRGYDQSVTALDVSNLNHADQDDPTKMPKLFDSSTGLVVENGKAAMTKNDKYFFALPIGISYTEKSIYSIITPKASGADRIISTYLGGGAIGVDLIFDVTPTNLLRSSDGQATITQSIPSISQSLFFAGRGTSELAIKQNNEAIFTGGNPDSSTPNRNFFIAEDQNAEGSKNESPLFYQFLLVYDSYHSSGTTNSLFSLINNEYNIYP
jgi:hypothetical protein